MRNVLNSISMLGFRFYITTTITHKVNKIIQMLVDTMLPKLLSRRYLCLAQEYLAVTLRLCEGGEKCIKIKEIKKGNGNSNFCI